MTPPRLARALLRRLALHEDRDYLVGDLDEEFADVASRSGRLAASAWYVQQVVLSIPALLRLRFERRHDPRPTRPPMFADVRSDFRDAWRRARRAPANALTVVLISALGIGASTAVYTVVHAVLIAPLPFAGSERVVKVENRVPSLATEASYLPSDNWLDFLEFRARARSFEALAAIWEGGTTRAFALPDETSTFPVAVVTEGLDAVLGVQPLLGRAPERGAFATGGPLVVALTEQFWRTRFGSDSSIIGRSLLIADTMRVVVGVMRDANDYPGPVAAWIPLVPKAGTSQSTRRSHYLSMFGRLRRGVSPGEARAEMQALVGHVSEGADAKARVTHIIPLGEMLTGPVRPMLLLLAAVVVVTLLVAAGNVALLLVTQAESRARELAIRLSLGSVIGRLARKLAVESMLLAVVGGLLGVVLARVLTSLIISFYPGRLVRAEEVAIGPSVLVAALGMTIVVGFIGAWPLLRRLRSTDLVTDLRHVGASASPRALRVRLGLVVGQLAFAVALVAGGTMLARAFVRLLETDPGFTASGVSYINVSASPTTYPDNVELQRHLDRAEEIVRGLPGVKGAASVSYLPLPSRIVGWGTHMVRSSNGVDDRFPIQFRQMSPDYVRVMGIPLRSGRTLTSADGPNAAPVALINETLATTAFPDGRALGRVIVVQNREYTVVGVIGDMRYWGLGKPVVGEVFVSNAQVSSLPFRSIAFTTAEGLPSMIAAARAAIRANEPSIVVSSSGTLTDRLAAASAPERFRALLVGSLAILALILAGLGLFAVSANAVAMRVREIGIRVALGASARRVRVSVMRDALVLAFAGTLAGLGLAWMSSRGLRAFLADAPGFDLTVCGVVAAIFGVTSLVAALVPAWRASRVDPLTAMRSEA